MTPVREKGRLLILGATGSLGRQVLGQSIAAGHEVTVLVRTPSRLPAGAVGRVAVHTGDLSRQVPVHLIRGHEALINCAGHVAEPPPGPMRSTSSA